MSKVGTVHVVMAMDTEGPIDDPHKPEILSSWERVDGLIDRLFSEEFRFAVTDSYECPAVFSWFVLTLTAFKTNPFKRAMGYHAVFDHYVQKYGSAMSRFGDGIYWHYHHPAPSGVGNEWSSDWTHGHEYDAILARYVIERKFFPSCFRAGGRIENNDTSAWLEEIIPFDYSSCSGTVNWDNIESDGKRLHEVCDWSRASISWRPYHPSAEDYQKPGSQLRWIFRCPDLDSNVHRLSEADIEQAFIEAHGGKDVVLAFFEHDRRMVTVDKLSKAIQLIATIATRHNPVPWRFSNAVEAALGATGALTMPAPRFAVSRGFDGGLAIACEDRMHGHAPFVAGRRDRSSEVRRIAPLTVGKQKWRIDVTGFDRIGIAANSPSGSAGVQVVNLDNL